MPGLPDFPPVDVRPVRSARGSWARRGEVMRDWFRVPACRAGSWTDYRAGLQTVAAGTLRPPERTPRATSLVR